MVGAGNVARKCLCGERISALIVKKEAQNEKCKFRKSLRGMYAGGLPGKMREQVV